METKTLVYDAFGVVLGNPDIIVLIAAFTLIVTILAAVIDVFKSYKR
ncbi:hypothetical protein [Piscibacillus halophilus]|nr:hypothetical protein [Piscibacillus halophilus]